MYAHNIKRARRVMARIYVNKNQYGLEKSLVRGISSKYRRSEAAAIMAAAGMAGIVCGIKTAA